MKVAIPLAKNVLAPLVITAAVSAIDAEIQNKNKKKKNGSGNTTLIISIDEMNDIIKIIHAVENSLKQESLKQLKMKQKNKKEDF